MNDTVNKNRLTLIKNIYTRHKSDIIGLKLFGNNCVCREINIPLSYPFEKDSDFHYSIGDKYKICSSINYCTTKVDENTTSFSIEIEHTFLNYYDFTVSKYYGNFSHVNPPFGDTQQLNSKIEHTCLFVWFLMLFCFLFFLRFFLFCVVFGVLVFSVSFSLHIQAILKTLTMYLSFLDWDFAWENRNGHQQVHFNNMQHGLNHMIPIYHVES